MACYSPWGRKESDVTEQLNDDNKQFLGEVEIEVGVKIILRSRGQF